MKWLLLIAGLLLFAAAPAEAQRFTATHTAVSVANATTQVIPDNASRNYLMLQNDSDTDLYCRFGTAAAVAHQGMVLKAGGSVGATLIFDYKIPKGAVQCISSGATGKTILVTEGK